jgi:hypothetical protein
MDTKTYLPFFRWVIRTLTGRWARRAFAVVFFLLLVATTTVRLRSYLMTRKIQSVLHGLAAIRLDQTSEEQLTKTVPYLTEKEWRVGGISHRGFYVHISTDPDRLPWAIALALNETRSEELVRCLEHLADWLGYRFMSFDASVIVEDGKVIHLGYGLANQNVRPQYTGYTGYIVSARSVHGFWIDRRIPFLVSSEDDKSPQYRPSGGANGLFVIFTDDAPPSLTGRAFQLNLSCFWRLRGCDDARKIAPTLWQDIQSIRQDTYQQLISGKCPDSIIEGRMRYLPDITVLLLEVTGSRRIEVNEEGDRAEDWFTDYRLKEEVRGQSFGSWRNVRLRPRIPGVIPWVPGLEDATGEIANQIYPETKIGTPVLFFGYPKFYSCRFIRATPSALEIVRKTPVPLKRREDQIPSGLQ